jgi:rubrerythrin
MGLDEILKATFKGETTEVGWYLAMSKIAEEEGLAHVATYLRQIAMDEAWHAAEVAKLAGMVKDTKSNLTMMLEGEGMAEVEKREAAEIARKEGNTAAALFFENASKDEARHKAGIKGIVEKL